MKEYIFEVYRPYLLRDMKVGEMGYVVINPTNRSEKEASFLTREMFILSFDLYVFETLEQVKRYLDITYLRYFILGVKRIGKGLTENDFILDLSRLKGSSFIGFRFIKVNIDKYRNNPNYLCFSNIKIKTRVVGMDSFLDRKEEEYSFNRALNNNEGESSLASEVSDLRFVDRSILNSFLEEAIKDEEYEYAAKIRDELEKRKNNKKMD